MYHSEKTLAVLLGKTHTHTHTHKGRVFESRNGFLQKVEEARRMCVCESLSGKSEEEVMMMEGIERALDNIEALLYTPAQTQTHTHTEKDEGKEEGGGTRERAQQKVQSN